MTATTALERLVNPPPDPPAHPIGRWLLDPAGPFRHVLSHAAAVGDWAGRHTIPLGVATVAAVTASQFLARHRRVRLTRGGRRVEVLAPPEVDPAGAAALWDHLHDLLRPRWRRFAVGQPHLVFEYVWSVDGLLIGVWVPGAVPPHLVEHAIEAAWPGARTTVVQPAPAPLPPGGHALGGEMRLARAGWYPLRTEHDADPLRALLGSVGDLRDGERAAVQVLARPATGRAVARCRRAAREVRAGRASTSPVNRLLDLVTPGPAAPPRAPVDPTVNPDVQAILGKADGVLWSGVVRYAVTTDTDSRTARRALRGRAHAIASAFALHATGRNHLARHRLRHPKAVLASRLLGRGSLLSTAELAALAHLPTDTAVVGLARAGARSVPPPPAVPRVAIDGKVLGDADIGPDRPIVLRASDARQHLHVMGSTGAGKSTLLVNAVLQDAAAGRGVVVVDPKGDLVTDILDRLDPVQRRRAIVLDPQANTAPPTLNMLEVPDGVDADLVVEHLIGIFRNIFQQHWGPRTDDTLRSACLTLLRRHGATLSMVPRLLTSREFLAPYLVGIEDDNPVLAGFWAWYAGQSEAQRAQIVGPVLNKLRAFLLRSSVRKVVDEPHSSIDMGQVLDGGLLLVRVPKGLLGEDTARLLGSFVVAKVWQAATGRAAQGEQARVDASLVIDEFQNFLTLGGNVGDMLAEARGYRLGLVLAHQHLGQLPRELREAVNANARNKLIFTCSPDDARPLSRHFAPELTEHDLSHLGAYQVAAKVIVGGQDQPAFTLRTRPAPPPRRDPAGPPGRRDGSGPPRRRDTSAPPVRRRVPPPPRRGDDPTADWAGDDEEVWT